ncbi:DDX58 [Mytilus coruscus]|uniref:DDX58 n=1 Tax=Mytilus coruscus TaxID=42192 RepID=A0A6J8DKC0_MYTCO|nr:DDX58 [Mytilus coruscus]
MEAVPTDKECWYYMKLVTFILEIGMEVLHTYFEQNILNAKEHLEFYMFLDDNKHYLFHECYPRVRCCKCSQHCLASPSKKGCLNKKQFMLLFDIGPLTEMDHYQTGRHNDITKECLCRIIAKRSNDVDCMDITLMYAIVQSCCFENSTVIHGNPRCIEVIKDTRNFLAHVPNARISKSEFDSKWAETEHAILEIGSSLGNYFAKMNKRKVDKFKNSELSMDAIKGIIENNVDEVKKNLQALIEDQRKSTLLVKDEIIAHLTKYKDELSVDIRNLRFEVKQYILASCSTETTFDIEVPKMNAAACGPTVYVTDTDKNVRKCRVEWRLETPSTWNLPEIKETLEKFSALLRQWFEIEFVYVGSLVIKTLVHKNVLDNRDEMRTSVHLFLEKIVEVCRINADVPTVIKVALIIEPDEFDKKERTPTSISLRQYQEELAEIALTGQNTIICAGTNSGKTYIAFHIIEDHLIKNPEGKAAFINRTNILLEPQYERACGVFSTLFYQRKINIWKAEEDDNDYFIHKIKNSSLIFLTPQALSNHLTEKAATHISIAEFTLIVLDECHHTYDNSNYNELMAYYRKAKYGEKLSFLPQILGLTASPGTKKAKDLNSAKHHLRTVMTNLDVSKLSIVKRNEEELLQYTTIPEKVSSFLIDHINDCRDLYDALKSPPKQRTEIRYIQWIAETKDKVEHVLHKDPKIPRLLHACFRHLELYTECLEVNSLLEVDQVCNVITHGYADESAAGQNAKTDEETEIVNKLKEVFVDIREIGRKIEKNPDVKAVIELLDREYQKWKEDSRFLIFVKTRATAKALINVLPDYLRSTYLTGSHKCIAEDGLPPDEQIAVLENFRNGDHLCVVATSVAFEGLDIPLCNLMIRYRFRANEISSLQMRGRVRRSKQGKEIHVGTLGEFETEEKNIKRQYLMTKAIKEVSELDIDISNAEKDIYQMEEMDRNSKILKKKQRRQALFRVHCKNCGVLITNGNFMRHINEKFFVVCDKGILRRVEQRELPKKKMRIIDGCQKRLKAFGLECGHDWGSIFIYKECQFLVLSQEGTKVFDIGNYKFTDCRKWNDLPFAIDEMSDEDIVLYKSQL